MPLTLTLTLTKLARVLLRRLTRDVQTEPIALVSRWTQHPSGNVHGAGIAVCIFMACLDASHPLIAPANPLTQLPLNPDWTTSFRHH